MAFYPLISYNAESLSTPPNLRGILGSEITE